MSQFLAPRTLFPLVLSMTKLMAWFASFIALLSRSGCELSSIFFSFFLLVRFPFEPSSSSRLTIMFSLSFVRRASYYLNFKFKKSLFVCRFASFTSRFQTSNFPLRFLVVERFVELNACKSRSKLKAHKSERDSHMIFFWKCTNEVKRAQRVNDTKKYSGFSSHTQNSATSNFPGWTRK